MKKLLIIASLAFLSSCSTLIMNQGFKTYESDIVKKNEYKKANSLQQDLLYLSDLCENSFPNIDSVFPRQERKEIIDSLLNLLSNNNADQQDLKIYARFYLSHFNNQHTVIHGLTSKMIYPYILRSKETKWYLWDINSNYDSLLIGQRVTTLNQEPIEMVEKKLSKYIFAENEINKRIQVSPLINRPDILKEYGIIEITDSILVSFENGKSIWVKSTTDDKDLHFHLGEKRFKSNTATKYVNHNYNIELFPDEDYAYFQFNRCHDKIDTYEMIPRYVKPWIIPFAKIYLSWQIKKKNAAKTRGFVDVDRPIFTDYLEPMFDSIRKQDIGNLIIDLRYNPGGSSLLCTQLLYYLTDREDLKTSSKMYYLSDLNEQTSKTEYDEFVQAYKKKHNALPLKGGLYPDGFLNCDSLVFEKITDPKSPYYIPSDRTVFKGKVIVLANSGTGSAAALFTTLLQDNNLAVIIGTSVGNNPTGATGFQPFKLPNSKFTGSVAPSYLTRPDPTNGKIQIPDYWIENDVNDLIMGRDRHFEKAKELIIPL